MLSAILVQPREFALAGLAILGALLTAAVWHDARTYRIPNAIVVTGVGVALAMHTFLSPPGTGLAGAAPGPLGLSYALGGLLVGLVPVLLLYFANAAGAGDAKLMGMTGAFLGPVDALGALLATAIAGIALALICAIRAGVARRMLANMALIGYSMLARLTATAGPSFDARQDTAAKVPYSIAIAAGTAIWMAVRYSI